jgi:multidrug efflux pump subunit AcrA (membrane-fusion protein)
MLLYIPVRFDYDIVSIGRVQPVRTWTVMQQTSGVIQAMLHNYKHDLTSETALFQFERGDLIATQLYFPKDTGLMVQQGDTVIRVLPVMIANRINELKAGLEVAEAEILSAITGQKPPVVAGAGQQIMTARNNLRLAEQDYEMVVKLMADSLVSQQELRQAKNLLENAQVELAAAQQYLRDVDTGVKPEDVLLAKKRRDLLLQQIANLQQLNSKYFLTAPFSGKRVAHVIEGAVLTLQDESEYLLHIPVKVEDLRYLPENPVIEVVDILTGQKEMAQLFRIPLEVQIIGGRRVVLLQALLHPKNAGAFFSTGMSLDCTIKCDRINQREYIKRSLQATQ